MAGKRVRAFWVGVVAALALIAGPMMRPARADGTEAPMSAADISKAKGVTQEIPLGDGAAKLQLRRGYTFLPAGDVPPILQKLGVQPPQGGIVGAVVADGSKPGARDYWISVMTLDAIGNVPENGADEIGSMAFLESVKQARPADPPLDAFAVTPAYDRPKKTLVWAEQYLTKGAPDLRYEHRLLGRTSVLGVTTIGHLGQLKPIEKAANDVFSMLSFAPGQTYADFQAGDRRSDYDLPGLITGKRKAGPLAEVAGDGAPAGGSTHPAFSLANFAPGGQYALATYALGGLALASIAWMVVGALRRGRGRSGDDNLTPPDADRNAV